MTRQPGIERAGQFVLAKFEPGKVAVVTDAVDAKAKLAKSFFALLDLPDALRRDLNAVLDA